MGDRVLILDQGKISQFATPEEIIKQPSEFVKEFILQQLQIKKDNIFQLFGDQNE